jgi:glycosyl transferase family 25
MIKSYLINLTKDTDRLASFRQQFDNLGLEFERISAVDGRETSQNDYEAFQRDRPRNSKKGWLRGQMGCFLSHYKAWELIAQGQDRFGAIFEDDIYVSEGLKGILANDCWITEGIDIIRLEAPPNRVRLTRTKILSHEQRNYFRILSTTWCTGAYLISREAARKAISLEPEHHQPADFILFSFEHSILAPQLNLVQCNPSPCVQDKFQNAIEQRFTSNIEGFGMKSNPHYFRIALMLPVKIINALYKLLFNYRRVKYQ